MPDLQRNRTIIDDQLLFVKCHKNDNGIDFNFCSSITNMDNFRYETTANQVDQMWMSSNSIPSQEILQRKEQNPAHIQQPRSELTNCIGLMQIPNSIMSSKEEEGLSHIKKVRWADVLVHVHTYISPRNHVLQKRLRKMVAKAASALKQDIEF